MRYLFLIHADEAEMKTWPEEEMYRCLQAAQEYDEVLRQRGHLIAAHGLEWPSQATVLRTQSGKVIGTDGPFAETKEQLLGFYLVEASHREEAVKLAAGLPMLGSGNTVEVRAVEEF